MKKAIASLLAVGAIALAPSFASADPDDESTAGVADKYLFVDSEAGAVEIWEESNGIAGLQRGENPDTKLA